MPSVKVRKSFPQDLQTVSELARMYTSFDTAPTATDIDGMQARNPDYFFVAEDAYGRDIGIVPVTREKEYRTKS